MSREKNHEFHIADRGFKFLLETAENKVQLLKLISPKLVEDLDLKSIQSCQTNVIEDSFREITEDVTFNAKRETNGEELQFLVIVAHQSSKDRFMPARLLRMMTGFWSEELRLKPKPKKLKHIRPILVYTGEKSWAIENTEAFFGNCFSGLAFGNQEEAAEVPLFKIRTLNLQNLKTSELLGKNTELGFGLALYRTQFGSEFCENRDRILETLKQNSLGLTQERQSCYLRLLFQLTAKNQTEETFKGLLSHSPKILAEERYKTMVKTYEQSLLEEGELKGELRGELKGALKTLRKSIVGLVTKCFPEACETETQQRLTALNNPISLQFILNRAFEWKSYEDVWTLPDADQS